MRVLLIRFSSLGDCVLLCPLAEHLARAGAEVTVLTKRAYADVFSAARGVARVVAIGAHDSVFDLWRVARGFRDSHVIIDAHASTRSRLVTRAAGRADARIRKHTRERLGLIILKRAADPPTMLERYAALAAGAGLPVPALSPGGIELPAAARAAAASAMPGDPYIAVAPGSRWPSKRWPGFGRLCEQLAREGWRVLLVGDEGDRSAAAPIAAALGERCIDATGRVPLLETAARIARCRAFTGNDSGLMHLAEAVGVPVVAMFGPTVREFGYYPSLPGSRTLERRLPCRPCSRNGSAPCIRGNGECLAAIPPAAVAGAIASLSDTGAPRRIILD